MLAAPEAVLAAPEAVLAAAGLLVAPEAMPGTGTAPGAASLRLRETRGP